MLHPFASVERLISPLRLQLSENSNPLTAKQARALWKARVSVGKEPSLGVSIPVWHKPEYFYAIVLRK
jgi:hypothetical protein